MAELTSDCCPPAQQAACCEPTKKDSCCRADRDGCGCTAASVDERVERAGGSPRSGHHGGGSPRSGRHADDNLGGALRNKVE